MTAKLQDDWQAPTRRDVWVLWASIVVTTAAIYLLWVKQAFFAFLFTGLMVAGAFGFLPWRSSRGYWFAFGTTAGWLLGTLIFWLIFSLT